MALIEKLWAALDNDNKVIGIWSRSYGPLESLAPPAEHVVDATGVSPTPAKGWFYDPATQAFSPAPPEPIVPTIDRVAVVSASNPSLSGVYPLDDRRFAFLAGVSSQIANGRGVPGGNETFNYYDVDNQPHAFTANEFLDFGAAISGFVSAALDAIHQVPGAEIPAQPLQLP